MRMPKIIVFTGSMGSGKSEALKLLQKYCSKYQINNVKFAQPLYDIQSYIYNRVGKEIPGEKDRTLLQFLGTEWGRNTVSKEIWTQIWERDIKHLSFFNKSSKDILITCDDCRFDNEADIVKNLGGKIIKIQSDKCAERINIVGKTHASENGVSEEYIDYIIENNSSLQEFEEKLKYVLIMEGLC